MLPPPVVPSAGANSDSRHRLLLRRVSAALVAGLFGLSLLGAVPSAVRPVAAAGDPVIAAAGDIACDPLNSHFNNGAGTGTYCAEKATANLLVGHGYSAVLSLGDNQYYCGSLSAYQQVYDNTWGQLKSITHPVPGNHEYLTSGGSQPSQTTGCDQSNLNGAGYFGYFGSAAGSPSAGYYSFNVGAWHLIALNTNCTQRGRLRRDFSPGQVARRGSEVASKPVRPGLLAHSAIQLRRPRQRQQPVLLEHPVRGARGHRPQRPRPHLRALRYPKARRPSPIRPTASSRSPPAPAGRTTRPSPRWRPTASSETRTATASSP